MKLPVLSGVRVVIVLETFGLGGAERQALLLARYLTSEMGADVQFWGFHPGKVTQICEEYGIRWTIHRLAWHGNRVKQLNSLVKFAYALRRTRPDVVLGYTMFPNVVCGLTWPWTGARLYIWNQRDEGRARVNRKAERWAIRQTSQFVSNSHHGAEFLTKTLGVKPDRIRVIPNGIELSKPESDRTGWRRQLEVADNCFLATMLANLQPFKDHVTLLRAWKLVLSRLEEAGRSAVLLLAGRFDQMYHPLKSLANDLELGRAVRFLGPVDDISGLVGSIDLGVFSSRFEGCPNGVLECMAGGLAIAGTDIPGIREAVGHNGYPLLAPVGDAEALADRILTLANDPQMRAKLGAANRTRVETQFNAQRMGEETAALIAARLTRCP